MIADNRASDGTKLSQQVDQHVNNISRLNFQVVFHLSPQKTSKSLKTFSMAVILLNFY
jgi:hypothetical protein